MKRKFLFFGLVILLSCATTTSFAQEEDEQPFVPVVPKWVSDKGYWQIESNINTPKLAIVTFYNNDGTLVYKEKVDAIRLNIKKKKILGCLKTVLEQMVFAWEQKHTLKENEMLVVNELKKH